VRSDWTFELTGLHGRQMLTGGGGRDWRVKAVSLAGNDFTELPIDFTNGDVNGIDVVLSNRHTEVTGQVTDVRGAVAATSRSSSSSGCREVDAERAHHRGAPGSAGPVPR
jgi:hypothetical protein